MPARDFRRSCGTPSSRGIKDDAPHTYVVQCEAGEQAVGGSFSKTDPVHGDAFDRPDLITGTATG